MAGGRFFESTGRIMIITGHYGSGKTEFAVSLAMLLSSGVSGDTPGARNRVPFIQEESGIDGNARSRKPRIAIIDLDIVNPYFRSRERREMLEAAGIPVYGSIYDHEVTAELPALGASLRAPLEDAACRVIIDAGGNDSGALVLNQFGKYFTGGDTDVLAVVNANRPDTRELAGALGHIAAIAAATGLTVTGIFNNCHLPRETSADTVIKGRGLCDEISEANGKPVWCDCYPEGIVNPEDLAELSENLMPLGLYMRPTWLDR